MQRVCERGTDKLVVRINISASEIIMITIIAYVHIKRDSIKSLTFEITLCILKTLFLGGNDISLDCS